MTLRQLISSFDFFGPVDPLHLNDTPVMVNSRPGMHQIIDDQDAVPLTQDDRELLRQMKIRIE
jgi:hypothetical protein